MTRAPGLAPDGITHLQSLGAAPRPTGTAAAAAAREYCARVLRESGYTVRERPFGYSRVPGVWGTPFAGVCGGLVLFSSAAIGPVSPLTAIAVLVLGFAIVGVLAGSMLRRGVLNDRRLRAQGVTLEATRGREAPRVWLVAHVDSKSQTVPMLLRVAGIVGMVLTALAILVMLAVFGPSLGTPRFGTATTVSHWLMVMAGITAAPVAATFLGKSSPGAVDNASGVAAVLAAAALVADATVGVLITDAEELGLAGARAWVFDAVRRRERPAFVLNCDGIDDAGGYRGVFTGRAPRAALLAMQRAATELGIELRTARLTPGILVDGVAFADAGWPTVTLMRGTARTLLRVHTRADSLARMSGSGVETAARILSRTAEALASSDA